MTTQTRTGDAQFDTLMAEMDARMQRQQLEEQQWLRTLLQAELDPSFDEAVVQASSALQAAEVDAHAARRRLDAHQQDRPTDAGQVSHWAKQKGLLTDELEAFTGIADDARARYHQAFDARAAELVRIWDRIGRNEAEKLKALQAQHQERVAQAQQALDEAIAQANHDVGAQEALLDRLRRNRPQHAGA
jgi:predicted DNA-binding WGR domain protein